MHKYSDVGMAFHENPPPSSLLISFCTPCNSCLNLFLKASLGQLAMLCSSSFFLEARCIIAILCSCSWSCLELLDEGAGDEVAPGGNISLLNWVGAPAAGAAFFS